MIVRGRIVVTVLTMGLAATVRADMMPVCSSDIGPRSAMYACSQADRLYANSPSPCGIPSVADLGIWPITCLPDAQSNLGPPAGTKPVPILTDAQNSFSLCLYALLGLGLCRLAPLVKKLSFGYILDWYHHGAPFQVGHSHAIGPDLCFAAVVCFIQPDCTVEDCLPQYYRGTVTSLLRKSQFTPTTLASRGPPFPSPRRRF
jgi:hypothetical protein